MEERAEGIIVRIRPLTESSLIIHWLTAAQGRIATVAKGARRAKSPLRGKLDLFFSADLSFQRSRRSDLHNLREVVLNETHSSLRVDLGRLQQASYCAALVEQTTETETPIPEIYGLFLGALRHFNRGTPEPLSIFAFEMKLLEKLGQRPELAAAKLSEGSRRILEKLVTLDWENIARLKISEAQETEMRQFLHGFLIYHLGKIPKGRPTAQ